MPELKGRLLTEFLKLYFKRYVEYDFTAKMEENLDLIASGKVNWKKILSNFWTDFIIEIKSVSAMNTKDITDNIELNATNYLFKKFTLHNICPKCNTYNLKLSFSKFGPFLGCSNYPDCNYTDNINDIDQSDQNDQTKYPKELGVDPQGNIIHLNKGPYGFYVQVNLINSKKPKRVAVSKFVCNNPSDITLKQALFLLSLPKSLGTDLESGIEIFLGIGRFGPYIQKEKKFFSIKNFDSLEEINIDKAMEIIANNYKKKNLQEKTDEQ
jgi:DNA topoisomerase-1